MSHIEVIEIEVEVEDDEDEDITAEDLVDMLEEMFEDDDEVLRVLDVLRDWLDQDDVDAE